ncbi:diguanylate cyclase [Marinobacter sp. F3R08]|uniref:GGDEF domain-containing response regulator n=1 Tax=Marinobacter sp. F3R08 TaxID=2841559 RepID=UPI001C0886A0|nr:diguanylate cyclase [Marinobacter sp. F3R08]MBU2954818.1 diguanylate cyclase [Marinobacter sp. F3R08]
MTHNSDQRNDQKSTGLGRQTVLLVDDQPLSVAFAAAEIEDLCHPITAPNGKKALELAVSVHPDLILLDVKMPDMSGFDVCRRLKQNPETADIAVIFLTLLDEEADEEFGLRLGAIDYIAKPFSPAILRARVRNHLLIQRQRMQLERMAQFDALTGLANRRSFDQVLHAEWQRLIQYQEPLCLLLIDVDMFKRFNDHYGHPAGDVTLEQVGTAIKLQMHRKHDIASRYGGEEFACILPHADAFGGRVIAEAIRTAVLELNIPHAASTISDRVTVSIGVACAIPDSKTAPAALVAEADRHLYHAKDEGRNRISSV